jgi:hypothetical protein
MRIILLLTALSSCGAVTADSGALLNEARAAISKEVGSPASAEFRNVRVAPESGAEIIGTVCGEMKAGSDQIVDAPFRRFVYSKANDLSAVEGWTNGGPDDGSMAESAAYQKEFTAFWDEFCK